MSELRHGLFLTTDETRTTEGHPVLLAIISDGTPQQGHDPVTVLTLETFPVGTGVGTIATWFARMKQERPWETRQ